MREFTSFIAYDERGNAVGYAFCKKRVDSGGKLASVILHQCEAAPDYADRSHVFRMLLDAVLEPGVDDCLRRTENLSMADTGAVSLLIQAGFETVCEQYLLVAQG